MISFACLGHWYVQILFGAPSAGIMLVMGRDSMRRKKRRRAAEGSAATPPSDPPPSA
jgi:membrane protein implicated in regulation of membrane protease activity